MFESTVKISRKQAEPIIKRTFPSWRGRKVAVEITEQVYIYDTNWSGGTRNQYAALQSNNEFKTFEAPAPWNNRAEGSCVAMRPGMMIVCHTMFCGKDAGIRIYIHPVNAPKWLTA